MGAPCTRQNTATLRQAGASDPLKQEPKVWALTWCLPEAPSLVSKATQAGPRNLRLSGKTVRIYSNSDHLHLPTGCHGNVPALSACLNLAIARKGLMSSLESTGKAWMTFSVAWTLMMNSTWWWTEKLWENLRRASFCRQGKCVELSCVLRQTVYLCLCHMFKAKVTLQ